MSRCSHYLFCGLTLSALSFIGLAQANTMPVSSYDHMNNQSSAQVAYGQAGSWIVRGGSATVSPTNDSGHTRGALSGHEVKANDDTQLGVSLTYMVTDNFGLELLASTPFTHALKLENGTKVGTTQLLPPTISAEYYFSQSSSKLRPYVGMGINYTDFFSTKLDRGLKNLGYSKLKLTDSVGLAGQVGLDYYINTNFLVNASVMYATIGTDATVSGDGLQSSKVKTNLNPWVYRVNFGYRF